MESVHQDGRCFHGISMVNDALQSLDNVQNGSFGGVVTQNQAGKV